MKKFNKGQVIIGVIMLLLLGFGLILYFIVNGITRNIGLVLLCVGAVIMFIFIGYSFGGWDMKEECEEHLSNIREGHRTLEEYQEKKIAEQKEEIKKLKAQIKKMRTARKL